MLHEVSSQIFHVKHLYHHPDWPGLSLVTEIPGTDVPLPSLTAPPMSRSTTSQLRVFAELWLLLAEPSCLCLQLVTTLYPFKTQFKTVPPWKDRHAARDPTLSLTSTACHVSGQVPLFCSLGHSGCMFNHCAFTTLYHSPVFLNTDLRTSAPEFKSSLLHLSAGSAFSFKQWA